MSAKDPMLRCLTCRVYTSNPAKCGNCDAKRTGKEIRLNEGPSKGKRIRAI